MSVCDSKYNAIMFLIKVVLAKESIQECQESYIESGYAFCGVMTRLLSSLHFFTLPFFILLSQTWNLLSLSSLSEETLF